MLLEVEKLSSGYGPLDVLHGVSFSIGAGETVAVLGANGAGKTTLARTIVGVLPVRRGEIRHRGKQIGQARTFTRARRGIVLVPEGRNLFAGLTVKQNIDLGSTAGKRRGGADDVLARFLDAFPMISDLLDRQAGLLSGGEQQMVALARAAAGRPDVLILDEPSLGLSPLLVAQVFRMIEYMAKEIGCAVLLIEQVVDGALKVADRAMVVSHGRVTLEGAAAELRESAEVREAYLGGNRS